MVNDFIMTKNIFETKVNNNTRVIHTKYNKSYTVVNKHLIMKNPSTGEWVDAVSYSPNYPNDEKLFVREKESFIDEFDLQKSYCEEHNCKFFINGIATCDGLGC